MAAQRAITKIDNTFQKIQRFPPKTPLTTQNLLIFYFDIETESQFQITVPPNLESPMPFVRPMLSCLHTLFGLLVLLPVLTLFAADEPTPAHNPENPANPAPAASDERIQKLENALRDLTQTVHDLRAERNLTPAGAPTEKTVADRVSFGMYGELHANFTEGATNDKFDIHRFVAIIGYEFADWIHLNSEVEFEHAFAQGGAISADGNGELELEQCYLDFAVHKAIGFRVGRVLIPLGHINLKHEPMEFPGVERPSFDNVIIPTTWWSDGIGIYGSLLPELRYQAYVVGGLNGNGFSALNGIRGGRVKGRPSLNEAAFTARIDIQPLARSERDLGFLRFALATYHGGLNNGPNGVLPNIEASMGMYAIDAEYSYSIIDLHGAIALTRIHGAGNLPAGVAREMFGWNIELAAHLMPDAWKIDRLAAADIVLFLRHDQYDTQYKMPSGVARNPAGDRTEWTFGALFQFTPNVGLKADYQIRDDATTNNLPDLLNFGGVWNF